MVARFKRYLSLSVPGRPKRRLIAAGSTGQTSSSSPLISRLAEETRALRSWHSRCGPNPSLLSTGLDRLDGVLRSLADLLQLPQEPIRQSGPLIWTDRLLVDSLRLADAFGTLRSEIAAVREHYAAAQTAIRRRDEPLLAASARSARRIEKELVRLAAYMRNASWSPASAALEAETERIVREAVLAMAATAESVVLGIAAGCWAPTGSSARVVKRWEMEDEKWRRKELERLVVLDELIRAAETKSEAVFRGIVDIRVALLNVLPASPQKLKL